LIGFLTWLVYLRPKFQGYFFFFFDWKWSTFIE
jgi:hypothetical protein